MGFGNMGRAIAVGLLEHGTISAKHIAVYDIEEEKREQAELLGATAYDNPVEFAKACENVLLAVKPQTMELALNEIKAGLRGSALVISIAAGISIEYIRSRLGESFRVARVMPNTPALVSAGAAGMAFSPNCNDRDRAVVREIFESIGIVELVPEELIDAVTALSGSGPAYFFYIVECLVKAARDQGLEESQATRLAAQTLVGAGLLLRESGESASTLRERVTSKGGTTEAALNAFRSSGLERIIGAGVKAAVDRAKELGQ